MSIPLFVFAQRDTEHWFAPMAARSNVLSSPQQALYFSTDSTTPFPVEIYSNNVVIGTVTISKGNPQTFNVPLNTIITSATTELFTPVNKGLYTKGTKPYFVTLRFSVSSHGEILTSKGKAGIGTKFYAVISPIENITTTSTPLLNFTTGIMATEDNTTVTVSNYSPTVVFTNGNTGTTHPTLTFTLNKGQSYIIEGMGNNAANKDGFMGAKIESNKPISVTNGNFNGQFALTGSFDGSDIVMDQSVPVDRLGNEFVVVKGNGNINERMEDAIIVATEDGTQVFINDATTPAYVLNEGEYYRVNKTSNNNYINQGNEHYNMYIKTSKNVYVYQLLAGVAASNATEGFNYIPPLNCYLPRKIDEIGLINILPPTTNNVKLNILTEAGAAVTVNGGTPTAAQGPYPVTGTNAWVSYSVPNVTGNITVTSTKAVTAGISGGSGVVGYGGYFAGFSSIPVIAKQTGDCIPGITLEVDDSFETYQWYRNNTPIPGATTNSYTPTQSGNYTVKITVGSCPPVTTPVYKVYTCLQETTKNETVCDGVKTIIPQFTNSTQVMVPSTVTIITPPANGNAAIDPATGIISYAPNFGYIGPDLIKYKFCGNDPDFTDCEEVTLNLTVSESPVVTNAILRSCFIESNPATALFNLTTALVTSEPGVTKKYYPSPTDAHNGTNEILNPTNYIAPNGVAYVKVINANGCYRIAEVTLIVLPPVKSTVLTDKVICVEEKTVLDAGPGFNGYLWSTGQTSQAISDVGVGTYWVDLKTGDCITRQVVKVYASEQPVITNIEISTTNLTVSVIGGTAPYQYSLDNIHWQDSNVFTEVPRGIGTVYVKDAYNCEPIEIDYTNPNIINVITPNGDGVNDILDYSALAGKPNLVFSIFDRYGTKIHQGDKANDYKWDGSIGGGKKVSTGSYWYEIGWNEPNKKSTPIKFTGWILVKNRD
ncbi:T9SS type B sorting domain-containing protein [Chryseobacterium oryctis]|uniref:T9SS type B sorting domain-containing protein n=1 Tax=Chryseobacterium oryctis TaxID=2952618 RepID=A0ABT3HKL2_9FLAO|nr:T9SS type B sorting domain-containing protein [Chryseobacterium oryctis]MCW3160325.1 T9SS type B sorting domain-containing protein [Chryseobacterium oryctis]